MSRGLRHRLGDGRLGDGVEHHPLRPSRPSAPSSCCSTSSTCQEIASPSRSGSVARIRRSAPFGGVGDVGEPLGGLGVDLPESWRSRRRAAPSRPWTAGRARGRRRPGPCSPEPRYLLMVLALAGLSTTTTFMRGSHGWPRARGPAGRRKGAESGGGPGACQRGHAGRARSRGDLSGRIRLWPPCRPGRSSARPASDSSTRAANTGRRRAPGGADQFVAGDRRRRAGEPARPFRRERSSAYRRRRQVLVRRRMRLGAELADGRSSARTRSTSSAPSQSAAPWRIRSLVPLARGSSGEPGTASTSRPCSAARRAVISEPERSSASTTTTASDRPEMIRLRRGKSRACAPGARRALGDHAAALDDARVEVGVLGRIDVVDPAAQHRHRAGGKRALVRRGVDAARQAGDDHIAGLAELAGQAAGEPLAGGRGDPRADDGDAWGAASSAGSPSAQISGGGGSSAASGCGKSGSQAAISRAPAPRRGLQFAFGLGAAGNAEVSARARRAGPGRAGPPAPRAASRSGRSAGRRSPGRRSRWASRSQSRRSASERARAFTVAGARLPRRSAAPRPSAGGGCSRGGG